MGAGGTHEMNVDDERVLESPVDKVLYNVARFLVCPPQKVELALNA